jgi:hypothetical protein
VIVHFDNPWFQSSIDEDIKAQHLETVAFDCAEVAAEEHFLAALRERLQSD